MKLVLLAVSLAVSASEFGYRFSVVSRSDDKVVVRTTCQKDTALFFRFCAK